MTFRGGSAKSIVHKMMKQDFITITKTDYMQEVKERLKIVYGVTLKFEPQDHMKFLKELEREGFITITEGGYLS